MAIPEFFTELLTAIGPSGHETPAAEAWRIGCRRFTDDVQGDTVGSSFARVAGTAAGPTLTIVGHIDEIGVHVSHISDEGLLHFGGVGGWDVVQLVGQRITLVTKNGPVQGVIGRKPIHVIEPDDRGKAPKMKELLIDIGAADKDEAEARVRIGDVGVVDVQPLELPNGRIVSRALDNRVGCYVAAEAARLVAEAGGAPGDVVAVAATQEETTFAGSRTTAYALQPDLSIAVDVTFADQPGIEVGDRSKHPMGSGPVIARGTTLHPEIAERLFAAAEEAGIEYTTESLGRGTGTDADAIHVSRAGVPTGLISVPLRYMHSPVELVTLADCDNAAKLIAAFAQKLEPGMSFLR